MKCVFSLMVGLLVCASAFGQRPIKLNRLWTKPQVHVLFGGYKLSFTIKNINRTYELLNEVGDSTWGRTSGLDTAKQYTVELYASHLEYKNRLQVVMQHAVGTFLLSAGQAQVRYKRRRLKSILMDIQPVAPDGNTVRILFYDPKNNKMIFSGDMPVDMYRQDIGIW